MEIHQLRYFLAVAEQGGMRQAARVCHVTQPTLSMQIQKLEDELGHRLFDRSSRGTELTEAGRSLLPRARKILGELSVTLDTVRADVERGRGRLRVGAIPTIAPFLLPPAVRRFQKQNPEAELVIAEDVTASLIEELVASRLDLAFMSLPLDDERITFEHLFDEPLSVVMAKEDPLAERKTVRPNDLVDRPPIVLHDMHCLGQRVQAYCEVIGLGEHEQWKAAQLATVQEWVALGLGVSLLPRMVAERDRSAKRVYRPLAKPVPTRAVVAAHRADRPLSVLGRSLVDAVMQD
ncbi:LysR family transcriptional regulator [Algisphaera agarilytica]|uniref:LysR family hydrogen peroxide-inducible transcriptional activator n=1 Tax=Algisphaera agarilytica TaxID=1385975 RepID=A0A7X0H5H5_9BACT|nr:LysR substrate-binding domain-containing protein [Algisphaera agarilytica]MBB6429620.1 LysR family hydrogen peroxide-inducible transcriptional activator [Algisphaera agarilytica]